MAGKSLSKEECALLHLMDKYKPHLKPYAYRQDAWFRVLEDYNEETGNLYRQPRTLKAKFNKMKASRNGEELANSATKGFELLKKLIEEIDGARIHKARRKRARSSEESQHEILYNNEGQEPDEDCPDEELTPGDNDKGTLGLTDENNDALQPPPLDSITIGFTSGKPSGTPNSSLNLTSERSPTDLSEGISGDTGGDVNLPHSSRMSYDTNVYKHLTTNLLELLSRKNALPNTGRSQDTVTLEQVYYELKEYQRSEQQFREEVLHRLDTIISCLDNKASFSPKLSPNS